MKVKRIVAVFLAVILLVVSLGIDANKLSVNAANSATYSPENALAYAKEHWNDGQGLCAEFVSRCVIAGGLDISVNTGTGGCWRAICNATGLERQNLVLDSSGYALKSANESILAAGDVLVLWCTACQISPHVMLCGGYDSKGRATAYAHNSALNNVAYNMNQSSLHTKSTCNVIGQVIHLTSLPRPEDSKISFDNVYVKSVTDTTASVRADVTAIASMYKEAGIYWGTTSDTTQKVGFDTSNNSKLTFIEVAFDGSEGPTLSRGTRYYYRFYAIRNDGTVDVDPTVRSFVTTGDSTSPQINSAWVQDTNGEGYTVVCTVSDDVAVDRVCCPTWTEANGQDDLFTDWYNTAVATKISDNTYTYRVNAADHNNEWGKYITHVYAYDMTGNQVNVELTETFYTVEHNLTAEFPLVDNGIYKIRSVGSNKVIDVPSGSSDNGVVLHQWENCAAESQKWKVVKQDDGYAFISVNSGKAMTIVDDSPYKEVRLTQNEYKASAGQTFKLIHRGDGKYSIHPVCSDMVLDVNGGTSDNGAEIMQYFYFGSDNQLWTFEKWDEEKPVISNVKIKNITANGFDVTCTVSDNVGISNVCFPTWTEANGQDDLVDDWYYNAKATSVSGNVYTYHVDIADHNNESGKYFTDIYAYDTSGNYVISNCTIEVPEYVAEVDPLEAFVTRMYQQCLSRDPDQSGLDGWVGQLRGGYMNGAQIAEQFVFSQEMLDKNLSNEDFVNVLYRAMMGREADEAGRTGWVNELSNGYLTRSEVTKAFVESTEFTGICSEYGITRGTYDASMAPIEHFVTRFYTLCLERNADQAGLYGWVNNLKNQYMNGAQIADAFIFSDEFVSKNVSDEKYVELLYNTLLGRPSDANGKAGWVGELQNGSMDRRSMMKAFIESTEFTGICEKYGITRGSL